MWTQFILLFIIRKIKKKNGGLNTGLPNGMNQKLLLAGLITKINNDDKIEVKYDDAKPTPRHSHSMTIIDDKIYLIGGDSFISFCTFKLAKLRGFVNAAFLKPVGFLEAGVLEDLFIVGVSLTLFWRFKGSLPTSLNGFFFLRESIFRVCAILETFGVCLDA